eukprot:363360-Chlamydomonas_euryale.AAC.6
MGGAGLARVGGRLCPRSKSSYCRGSLSSTMPIGERMPRHHGHRYGLRTLLTESNSHALRPCFRVSESRAAALLIAGIWQRAHA